jgi:hypothetical protein
LQCILQTTCRISVSVKTEGETAKNSAQYDWHENAQRRRRQTKSNYSKERRMQKGRNNGVMVEWENRDTKRN